ncbi:MAG: hypothetical protein ABWZ53_08145 [Actinomycetota bacterium]
MAHAQETAAAPVRFPGAAHRRARNPKFFVGEARDVSSYDARRSRAR